MTSETEEKILSLFALVNSYSQIAKHTEDFYCAGFSKAAISAVTDRIIPNTFKSGKEDLWTQSILLYNSKA